MAKGTRDAAFSVAPNEGEYPGLGFMLEKQRLYIVPDNDYPRVYGEAALPVSNRYYV